MNILSDVLTGLAVVLAVNSVFLRFARRYVPANCGFAVALVAQSIALMLHHVPLWEPVSLIAVGAVLLVLALVELVREREAAWSEVCPCCEHPYDVAPGDDASAVADV